LNKITFFTKNGLKLEDVDFCSNEDLYPAVSLREKDQSIRFNFGDREFIYDIKQYIKEEKDKITNEILKFDLDFEKLNFNSKKYDDNYYEFKNDEYKIITDYLIYNVLFNCLFLFFLY